MSSAVQEILARFEKLSEEERRDATREILRRTVPADYGPLSDDALAELADEIFVELDKREATP